MYFEFKSPVEDIICKYLPQLCSLSFHVVIIILCMSTVLNCQGLAFRNIVTFYRSYKMDLVLYLRIHWLTSITKKISNISFQEFCSFTFRVMTYFNKISANKIRFRSKFILYTDDNLFQPYCWDTVLL